MRRFTKHILPVGRIATPTMRVTRIQQDVSDSFIKEPADGRLHWQGLPHRCVFQSRHCALGPNRLCISHHMTEQHPPPSAIDCVDVVRSGFKLDATVSSKLTLNTLRWCLFRISSTALKEGRARGSSAQALLHRWARASSMLRGMGGRSRSTAASHAAFNPSRFAKGGSPVSML